LASFNPAGYPLGCKSGGVDMDTGLTGRTAIVAGGSRGIGKAIALGLAREGVDMVITARNLEALSQTASQIAKETGRNVTAMACDVTDRAAVDAMVDAAVEALGGLNILVNSASLPGGSPNAVGRIETIVDADFLNDFDTKYMGALRCARAAIPHMQAAGWGRIINISGGNARTPGNLSGGARNTSLVHFTRTLALQLGRDGITVNCIHPGMTRTERTAGLLAARAQTDGITSAEVETRDYAVGGPRANALGRMVDASEVADVAVFLASRQAGAMTGELLNPNGGAGNAVYY
jgi:NAD(P)-dependent dehydrogenase (short-subunit alcohol dehydrogenase family)